VSLPDHPNTGTVRRTFYRSGRVLQEVPVSGKKITGVIKEWHKNGVLAAEIPMKDGLRHGICKQWNSQGGLLGSYKMEMGTGTSRQWHPNGQLRYEAHLIEEIPNGRLRTWEEDGELLKEEFYLAARKVSKEKYSQACVENSALPVYEDDDSKPTTRIKRLASSTRLKTTDHERLIERLLRKPSKAEALSWLGHSDPTSRRTLGAFETTRESLKLVREIYHAGATEVIAVDIEAFPDRKQNTEKLIVTLPSKPAERKAVFAWCSRQGKKISYSPEKDSGEKHLYILLD
jgi:hypothetical protein